MRVNIPSAKDIDYCNIAEISGYQMLLSKMYVIAGGFNLPLNEEAIAIQREGLIWLREVKLVIEAILNGNAVTILNLGDIPDLLGSYDFFYRVCHGNPCPDYIRMIRLKSADKFVKGEKSISGTHIALMLNQEKSYDIRFLDRRYLDFAGTVMGSWINDLEMYGRLRNMPLYEAYEVLTYLLTADLFAYLPDLESKERWIKSYMLNDGEIDALDTKTLWKYICFDHTAGSYLGKTLDELDDRYIYLVKKLSEREDIHHFFRECIAIDLEKYMAA